MASKKTILFTLFLTFPSLVFATTNEWAYPQDTPKAEAISIGMASDRPIDISRYLMARGPFGSKINKKGTKVAYISKATGRDQLWVVSASGGQPKQLTYGNGITFFEWHPDSVSILYGADNEGDEREAYYLITADGSQEQIALQHSKAYRSFGAFDESGKRFTYASTERNGRDFDIYMHDIKSAKNTLIYQAEFGFFPSKWRPGSSQILVTETRGEDGNNLFLLDTDSGQLETIFKPQISAAYSDFNWLENGQGFYFSSNQSGEMLSLQFHDMTTGKTQTVASADYDIEDVMLCNKDRQLLWTINNNGFETLQIFDRKTGKAKRLDLPQGTYTLSCADNYTAVARINGPHTPGTVVSLDLSSGQYQTLLEPDMVGIKPTEMITPQIVTFPARDGVTLQGLLYLPKSTESKKPPLVVDIHGGPTGQSKASWAPLSQYLVGKGIAVLDINVRGSTGFGKTYARLDNQEKRLDSVRDLVDALDWLKKDGRVDADRAAAIGGSYGGYMVNAVMGAYPDAFKAGASFVGVADWVRALQTASPGLKASDRIEYGDISNPKWQEFYAVNSPINTVDNITAPMFFQHGVNDPRDPVTESDSMVKALRKKNIPVTYLRFNDEGHSISKLENRVIFYRKLAAFLEQHL